MATGERKKHRGRTDGRAKEEDEEERRAKTHNPIWIENKIAALPRKEGLCVLTRAALETHFCACTGTATILLCLFATNMT